MNELIGRRNTAPYVHLSLTSSRRMWLVAACLLAAIMQSASSDGFYSLLVAGVSVLSALAAELLADLGRRRFSIGDGSAVVSGLVLALLLPNRIHLAIPILGSLFAILVIKRGFGGLGANWLNPALATWLLLRMTWPEAFEAALTGSPLEILGSAVQRGLSDSHGNPLALLKIAGLKTSAGDALVTRVFNDGFFSLFGAELPEGYIDFLVSSRPGIIADRGILILIPATIILQAAGVVRRFIPLVFMLGMALGVRIFGALPFGGAFGEGDVLFTVVSGGTLCAAFILMSDPTSAITRTPIMGYISAFCAGLFGWLLRYSAQEPYGIVIAVLMLNAVTPVVREFESRIAYRKSGLPDRGLQAAAAQQGQQ